MSSRPHVINDRNARFASQQRAVADLDSQALVRAMQHRLAMKTDHVDLVRLQALFVKEIMNSNGMEQCQVMLKLPQQAGTLGPVFDGARIDKPCFQPRAKTIRIIHRGRSAPLYPVFAVGSKKSNVDPIHRGAAHQSYCAFQIGHAGVSLLFPVD
ncbi:Uncharacterised protein [Brucella neotomae]|nr:Uncharacterised protein [Brucella neotomae]